jgi:hypothetical protein
MEVSGIKSGLNSAAMLSNEGNYNDITLNPEYCALV